MTIDDGDYIFAAAYDDALGRRDSVEARRIGDAYIDYMERVFAYYEKQAAAIMDVTSRRCCSFTPACSTPTDSTRSRA